ncbi:MAG: LCP family protein [Actinobacteria bacterium]|nr:LCP family protein [Actinomycetota bacterium]
MPIDVHETDRRATVPSPGEVFDRPAAEVQDRADDARTVPRRRRRSSGRRRSLRRSRRRRRLLRTVGLVVLLAGLAALGIWGATLLPLDLGGGGGAAGGDGADAPAPTSTLVFVTFDEQRTPPAASLVFVLEADREPAQGTVLFVPTTTVADIPGHGLDQLGRAYAFGDAPLLLSTLDNLLGVHFDGVVTISASGWASVFERIGGLTVDVPSRLVATDEDGTSRVRFEPGTQHLDGPRLAEYLTFEEGAGDLDRLARASRVIEALFAELAADPASMDQLFSGGAPMFDTPVPDDELRSVLAAAVAAAERDALGSLILPVTPVGSGEDGSLRIERERADALIADRFADSIPSSAGQAGRRLQILNGNGEPGIGQDVAELLVPAGFVVRLTDNANSFDHDTTRIIVYDDAPAQLALARDVQRLLGVGQIEISRTPQSVVDITIVVGQDFLER